MAKTKGLKWRGRFYVKKTGGVTTIFQNGLEVACGGFVLPPYAVPVRYWASWSGVAALATTSVFNKSYFKLGFRSANIPNDQETQESAVDVTLNTMIGRYLPIADPYTKDDSLETDAGFPGDDENVSDYYRRTAFIDREYLLGLPRNGFLSADNSLFYTFSGRQSGKFDHSHLSLESGKFIGWSAWTDEIPDNIDDAAIMWGDTVFGGDLTNLYNSLIQEVGSDTALETILSGVGMSANAMDYLNSPKVVSGSYEAEDIRLYNSLTVQVELYTPAMGGKILTPG